jgi:hypothetical protein
MPKSKRVRPIPVFSSEQDERIFWETHDTSDYVDWRQARIGFFPNLKPSRATISLRLPVALLAELKALANRQDVPYQSLLKVYLADRVALERTRESKRSRGRRSRVPIRTPVRV